MTRKRLGILMMATLACTTTGCLRQDTRHSLYLSADGRVAWTAVQKDVRSDESDPADRKREEDTWLAMARESGHAIGRGLQALGPSELRTTVVRADRPFVVVTQARFDRVDRLVDRLLAEVRLPGYATLTRDGIRTTLMIHVDLGDQAADGRHEEDSPVMGLLDDLDRYRIVLIEGRFIGATGFTIEDDGTAATIAAGDPAVSGQVYDLALTWESSTSEPRTSSDRSSR